MIKCSRCLKEIKDTIKVQTQSVPTKTEKTKFYCEKCFKKMNKEEALNDQLKQKEANKRKNNKRK